MPPRGMVSQNDGLSSNRQAQDRHSVVGTGRSHAARCLWLETLRHGERESNRQGRLLVIGVIGAIILAMAARPIPEVLVALGSAAVGALAGLLAPSPMNRG